MGDDDESIDIGLINLDSNVDVLYSDRPVSRTTSTSPFTSSSPNLNRQLSEKSSSLNTSVSLNRSRTLPRLSSPGSNTAKPTATSLFSVSDGPLLDHEAVESLRRWVLCFVSVVFDLEEGPVIESVYPPCPLSEAERSNMSVSCFLSLPDANRVDSEVQVHSFRTHKYGDSDVDVNSRGKPADGFIYGFSCFSRRKDRSLSRGYEQRATVLVSYNAWPSLFTELIKHIGSMRLTHGLPVLESVCHSIANWPSPEPGKPLELGVLGNVWTVELPMYVGQRQIGETSFSLVGPDPVVSTERGSQVIRLLGTTLPHIWSIWECLVLCKPLLVLGQTPTATSEVIWWLLSLLGPIPFAGDFRPYLTVHDKDFSSLVNRFLPRAGIIVGVTNPFVATTCKHWPEKLTLTESQPNRVFTHGKSSFGTPLGWRTSSHNRHISKDKLLLKRFEELMSSSSILNAKTDEGLSAMLRQHFVGRSFAFLSPLGRHWHVNKAIPGAGNRRSSGTFNRSKFLESLKDDDTSPLPFRSKKKRKEFYERWINSPSFGLWIARQEEMMTTKP